MKGHTFLRAAAIVLSGTFLAACGGAGTEAARVTRDHQDPRQNPGYVVDSLFPMEEELRRFREKIPDTPARRLAARNRSRVSLARDFFDALVAGDTATLRTLHLTISEFAFLYFPTSEFAAAPYELKPALLWHRMTRDSDKGVTKAMQKIRGNTAMFIGVDCAFPPKLQGDNRIWEKCIVRWRDNPNSSETRSARLFSGIIELDGLFKILSYANDL